MKSFCKLTMSFCLLLMPTYMAQARDSCVIKSELEDCYATKDEAVCNQKNTNMQNVTQQAYGCMWVGIPHWTGHQEKYCGIFSTGQNRDAECYQLSIENCEHVSHCRVYRPEDLIPV